jgi:tetratricopeptide (TPR) repeat protein
MSIAFTAVASAQKLKLSASVRDLEAAARRDSNDAAAHYNLALGFWSQKRWDEAERAFSQAVGIEYRFAAAHLGLAFLATARLDELIDAERKTGDTTLVSAAWESRRRLYRRAMMLDPFVDHRLAGAIPAPKSRARRGDRGAAWVILLYLLSMPTGYFDALGDLAEGKDEAAFERLTRLVEKYWDGRDSVPAEVIWYRALSAVRTNRLDVAIDDLERLLAREVKLEEDSVVQVLRANDYRYALALLRQRAGDVDESIELFQQVLTEDLGMYMAHVRLADIHESASDWPRALRERQLALEGNPDDPTLLLELGLTLGKAGQFPAADSVLLQAARAAPRDSRVPYYRGLVAAAANDPARAREAFTQFLALAPTRYARQIEDARRRLDALP